MTTPPPRGNLDLVPDASTPRPVRVGVTGHRNLNNPDAVRRGLERVFEALDEILTGAKHSYVVVSPLAEGADRLVAEWVLDNRPDSHLEAILPMPREDYYETFSKTNRAESVREFDFLWSRAERQLELPKPGSNAKAYVKVGVHVVEHCEVLIAIWDGRPELGEGGTASVVRFAREHKRPLFWVHPEGGAIRESSHLDRFASDITFFREYNQEPVAAAEILRDADERLRKMQETARQNGLDPAVLDPLGLAVLPHFAKATSLAATYQQLHFYSTTWAYALSAAAVITAAVGFLFWPHIHWIYLLEFLEILAVILLTLTRHYRKWQRNWIDYRFFAERLRASCFLFVADLHEDIPETPADLRLSWLPDDRVLIALRTVLASLPKASESKHSDQHDRSGHHEAAKKFLLAAWIDDQQKYYQTKTRQNQKMHNCLERWLMTLLALTLVVALLHLILSFWMSPSENGLTDRILDLVAVSFPAVASAVAGVSVFRHFNRIAERYESMSEHLRKISEDVGCSETQAAPTRQAELSPLQCLVRDADAAMMHEHQGWRTVIGVHLPGPG